ncbi:NUDIX domain-containing protein [Streptomyces sp. NPDC057287]|uniref:NUDIX domain-containing protein n=1 Tax=Streptomyces sp. NPDC057287 TaxID=3346086 RepID=UPI003645F582
MHPAYREDDRWLLPGEVVEPGEHPQDACRREIAEELGLPDLPLSGVLHPLPLTAPPREPARHALHRRDPVCLRRRSPHPRPGAGDPPASQGAARVRPLRGRGRGAAAGPWAVGAGRGVPQRGRRQTSRGRGSLPPRLRAG